MKLTTVLSLTLLVGCGGVSEVGTPATASGGGAGSSPGGAAGHVQATETGGASALAGTAGQAAAGADGGALPLTSGTVTVTTWSTATISAASSSNTTLKQYAFACVYNIDMYGLLQPHVSSASDANQCAQQLGFRANEGDCCTYLDKSGLTVNSSAMPSRILVSSWRSDAAVVPSSYTQADPLVVTLPNLPASSSPYLVVVWLSWDQNLLTVGGDPCLGGKSSNNPVPYPWNPNSSVGTPLVAQAVTVDQASVQVSAPLVPAATVATSPPWPHFTQCSLTSQ